MNKLKLKEYHRPFMIIEAFAPNEFIASCVNQAVILARVNGQYCFDLNHNKIYDTDPNEGSYLGGETLGGNYLTDFWKGDFRIVEEGRFYNNGGEAYLYLGSSWNYNGSYSYLSEDFAPLYYAIIAFKEHYNPGVEHETTIYYTVPGNSSGITNAS